MGLQLGGDFTGFADCEESLSGEWTMTKEIPIVQGGPTNPFSQRWVWHVPWPPFCALKFKTHLLKKNFGTI